MRQDKQDLSFPLEEITIPDKILASSQGLNRAPVSFLLDKCQCQDKTRSHYRNVVRNLDNT